MGVAVTDDEIVAMSGRVGRRWEGPLPSIDLERPESLIEAAARGIRSLRIRGLVAGEDDDLAEEALDLARAASGDVLAVAFLADQDRPLLPIGPGVAVIRSGEEFVVDVALADGTHDIATVAGAQAGWGALRNLLEGAVDAQFPAERVVTAVVPEPGGEAALAVVSARDGARAFRVDAGTVPTQPLADPIAAGSTREVLERARTAFTTRAG